MLADNLPSSSTSTGASTAVTILKTSAVTVSIASGR